MSSTIQVNITKVKYKQKGVSHSFEEYVTPGQSTTHCPLSKLKSDPHPPKKIVFVGFIKAP